jgi:hypothetical protein
MLAAVLVVLLARTSHGEIIVDQRPDQYGGYASDTDFYDSLLHREFWQREADNILLDRDANISHLRWWGFYGGDDNPVTPPPVPETVRVRVMGARPGDGLPDESSVLFTQDFLNPGRMPTGRILVAVGGQPAEQVYDIDFNPPIPLFTGVPYWLEVMQLDDFNSAFRWEQGVGLVNGHAFENPLSNGWYASEGSFGFQLSSIPEPSSVVLTVIGGCVAAATIRGRRR